MCDYVEVFNAEFDISCLLSSDTKANQDNLIYDVVAI